MNKEQQGVTQEKEVTMNWDYTFRKKCPIKDLDTASFNPPGRVTNAAIHSIVETFAITDGHITSPIQVGKGMIVADGHRRLAAAKLEGHTWIPAMIYHDVPSALLYSLNRATRPFDGRTWMETYVLGLEPEHIKPEQLNKIMHIQDWVGFDYMRDVMVNGPYPVGTGVYNIARTVSIYCEVDKKLEWMTKITKYLVELRQQTACRNYTRDGGSAEGMLTLIDAMIPLKVRR